MNLKVSIEYKTAWGEEIVLCLGGKRYPLTYVTDGIWEGEVSRLSASKTYEYSYEVVRDGQTVRKEWKGHQLAAMKVQAPEVVTIYDVWHDRPADSPFYSSAFTNAIFGRETSPVKAAKGMNAVLKVAVPTVRPNEVLALAGTGKGMDEWGKIIPFSDASFPVWTLPFEADEVFEYKLLMADKNTLEPIAWEDGANRWFTAVPEKDEMVIEEIHAAFSGRNWKGAGTAIPVFSLRSEDDFGVGEFYDLKKMVDWAAATGQSVLQLLPINDTTMFHTWEDS